jgi:hypothetical protein
MGWDATQYAKLSTACGSSNELNIVMENIIIFLKIENLTDVQQVLHYRHYNQYENR